MPTIYDNIDQNLVDGLKKHLFGSQRIDACVGYFNMRGWKVIANQVDLLSGEKITEKGELVFRTCRLLVGMIKTPKEEIAEAFLDDEDKIIDNKKAAAMKKHLAEEFREQLVLGTPTFEDEVMLKKLLRQLKEEKVVVRLYLRHSLHAKLYLTYSSNAITPKLGLLGSSNLTFSGLSGQGELNVDVLEQDTAQKLEQWFSDRWNDLWCIDITSALIDVLESSWARQDLIPPYHIYLKMAYHLSREARTGINEFSVPKVIGKELLDFQEKAVLIAAHHLSKRGGVIIGDVVGLGKTIMATALAKIFEDDLFYETLVLCPKNLVEMWEFYVYKYQLHAKVISQSRVTTDLKDLRRYRLVIIDESHSLRNRNGRRYQAIKEYLDKNESKVVLLTATPYNMSYLDLSNQLRLFLEEDVDLGISPEHYISDLGGIEQFSMQYPDIALRSISAFEKSDNPDDWRELMKLYMVRRTRSFIKQNYSKEDSITHRRYLTFSDGSKSFFTERIPKKVEFRMDVNDSDDQYAKIYSEQIVGIIDELKLPRYGLANYFDSKSKLKPTSEENEIIKNLSRAGSQLLGFTRTTLFKRLESSGIAFLLSVSRHILRNCIFIYAVENKLPLPIGKQYMNFFDEYLVEIDSDTDEKTITEFKVDRNAYMHIAEEYYIKFTKQFANTFSWIRSELFGIKLLKALIQDTDKLISISEAIGTWDSAKDRKFNALQELLVVTHKSEKILVFTQFADTAVYLKKQLDARGISKIALVTGDSECITNTVQRFSPISNNCKEMIGEEQELRIIITTDILSEGQNLQDAHIVVNYDLPWAIIRLIQRAGRVDRIGQISDTIYCYSFLPEDGIEHIIRLRSRLKQRIGQNAEVVGSDEVFFDGDPVNMADLYSEKSGILVETDEGDIDLASYAYQIWKNAIDDDPTLLKIIPNLPNVIFSAKANELSNSNEGVIIYTRTTKDNDILTWIDTHENVITQSQYTILRAAKCFPDTKIVEKLNIHHELVRYGVKQIISDERKTEGTLGKKNSIKYRVYMSLMRYFESVRGTLFADEDIKKSIDDIYRYPLRETAIDSLGRQLRIGISDEKLSELVKTLKEENKLCIVSDEDTNLSLPQVLCSMGIINKGD